MEATDQNGPRLLNAVTPRNLLSFGPDNEPLELNGLNVLHRAEWLREVESAGSHCPAPHMPEP